MEVGLEETVETPDSNYSSRHILPAQVKQKSSVHTKHKIQSPQNNVMMNEDVLNVMKKSLDDRVRNAQERSLESDLQVNGMDYMRHQQGNVGQSRVSVIHHADTRDDPILNQAVSTYSSSEGCSGLRTSPGVIGPQHGEQNLSEKSAINSVNNVEYTYTPYVQQHVVPAPEQGYLGQSPSHCYPETSGVRPYGKHGVQMSGHALKYLNYLNANHLQTIRPQIRPQQGQGQHTNENHLHTEEGARSQTMPQQDQSHHMNENHLQAVRSQITQQQGQGHHMNENHLHIEAKSQTIPQQNQSHHMNENHLQGVRSQIITQQQGQGHHMNENHLHIEARSQTIPQQDQSHHMNENLLHTQAKKSRITPQQGQGHHMNENHLHIQARSQIMSQQDQYHHTNENHLHIQAKMPRITPQQSQGHQSSSQQSQPPRSAPSRISR